MEKSNIDKNNMLGLVDNFPQMMERIAVNLDYNKFGLIEKVVICGMGGSAIAGNIIELGFINNIKIPVFVNKDFDIPQYIDGNTLAIIISYSGNTKESISMLALAKIKTSKIIIITSGGKLLEIAKADNLVHYVVPNALPPRAALPYLLTSVIQILQNLGIISKDLINIVESIDFLKKNLDFYRKVGAKIAGKIKKKVPIIITSSGICKAAGLRFKNQLNENSKRIAILDNLPEMCHNFLEALSAEKKPKTGYFVILLTDKDETTEQITTARTIFGILKKKFDIIEISSKGNTILDRILSLIILTDYVSVFLALLNNIDPTSIEAIKSYKKEMEKL